MAHIQTCQSASREHGSCNYIKTPQSQSWTGSQKCSALSKLGALQSSCPCHLDTNVSSPPSRKHATFFSEIVRCKKGNGKSSMKKSIEDPSGSHFMHNLSSIQKQDNSEMTAESMSADSSNQSNPEGKKTRKPLIFCLFSSLFYRKTTTIFHIFFRVYRCMCFISRSCAIHKSTKAHLSPHSALCASGTLRKTTEQGSWFSSQSVHEPQVHQGWSIQSSLQKQGTSAPCTTLTSREFL